ncbi:pyridoxamine 5'-phosphate oxidase family protein [Psychrobacter sp. DAB_AL43B]|uniref:pyridoxamine 5'-phosphate oxidase family protein n=1 Tax=Psychrobacter sp. DAB_AL43B TaxID=1028416 RepID=UPI0009A645B4|nr:pyridoxamine 5'-phosphate oxidase family protein [Psychrobacter sp. DAB_AL43B]SLJ83444.1 Pyridoxamine 5'-phosphate oxidase [Psychrobacter sp. DAB_AL43B]
MNIDLSHWNVIKRVFAKSQRSNMHANIASVSKEGMPNITPIGTVFLNEDGTGFLFDSFSQKLAENLKQNSNVCISAVNSSKIFWLSSFIKGQFDDYPGVRLYTKLGELRLATDQEKLLVNTRIRSLKWTKGSKLIWSDFTHVREFKVDNYRWIQYPSMMDKLT